MDLDQEFKKLNYALKSYKCDHHADYEVDGENVTFLLLDAGELPIITREVVNGDGLEKELTGFKKQAINFCSHVKLA